jgi:flagellar basal-body rod modification protein FlgD
MESNEFTNQLVQFSQVEQGILTNEKLDSMLSQTNANQMGQSLSYIGKDVYYKGDTVFLEDMKPLKIGYAIDGDPKSAKMRILDKDGTIVRTMEIPATNVSGNLTWDGKDDFEQACDDGIYTVRIDALSTTDEPIETYAGVPAHVEGVETLDGTLYLALNGDRRIEAATVLSISEPDIEVAPDEEA